MRKPLPSKPILLAFFMAGSAYTALDRPASADVIVLRCAVHVLGSSETSKRLVQIDTEALSVRDNSLTWREGQHNPMVPAERQHVRIGAKTVQWGEVNEETGESISSFAVDLEHGTYRYDGSVAPLSRGTCTRSVPAS